MLPNFNDLIRQTQAVGIVLASEMEKAGQLVGHVKGEADEIARTLQNEIHDHAPEYENLQAAYANDLTIMEPASLIEHFCWFTANCMGEGYARSYVTNLAVLGKRSPLWRFYQAILKHRLDIYNQTLSESGRKPL